MQDGGHAGADEGQRGAAEGPVPAVDQLVRLVLHVDEEAARDAPVEEDAVEHVGVGALAGAVRAELFQQRGVGDFGRVDGQGVRAGVEGVAAEFAGQDPGDAGGDGGAEEGCLVLGARGAEAGDQGVLAGEGGGEAFRGGVVDCGGFDAGGERAGAVRADEGGDGEACVEEGLGDGGAEGAGGTGNGHSFDGGGRHDRVGPWGWKVFGLELGFCSAGCVVC